MSKHYMNPQYQRNVADFVGREVVYCVSCLVSDLQAKAEHFPDEDDLIDASMGNVDYEEAATQAGWRECADGELHDDLQYEYWNDDDEEGSDADDWQELCDEMRINYDDYTPEVYEHWIVSDYLARQLSDHGQKVVELFGLTIWCRTCTGQAISMDGVIQSIYDAGPGQYDKYDEVA